MESGIKGWKMIRLMKDGTQVTQMVMIKNDLKKWKVEKGEWKM